MNKTETYETECHSTSVREYAVKDICGVVVAVFTCKGRADEYAIFLNKPPYKVTIIKR